jgi:hypothetical protein
VFCLHGCIWNFSTALLSQKQTWKCKIRRSIRKHTTNSNSSWSYLYFLHTRNKQKLPLFATRVTPIATRHFLGPWFSLGSGQIYAVLPYTCIHNSALARCMVRFPNDQHLRRPITAILIPTCWASSFSFCPLLCLRRCMAKSNLVTYIPAFPKLYP